MKKLFFSFFALLLGCFLFGAAGQTVNQEPTLVTRSGNGDTLIGKVSDADGCLGAVTVTISNEAGFTASTTTRQSTAKFNKKLGCPYGYEFLNLEEGTYTLTYSKDKYITKSQDVTVVAGENIAPAVILEKAPIDYIFEGKISYLDIENVEVAVESAKVIAYAKDSTLLGETYTDEQGMWSMTLPCQPQDKVYFTAEHPNIIVNQWAEGYAVYESGNQVKVYCLENMPDLLMPETYKVKQLGTIDEPLVEISWTWPQELREDYMWEEGKGLYMITSVLIKRPINGSLTMVGKIQPEAYELPATSFVDGLVSDYKLNIGKKYNYTLEIQYSHPYLGIVTIENDESLTITLSASLSRPDSVDLVLEVDDEMGTVQGAGKYEKGDQAVVQAQAKPGYLFVAWKEGDEILTTTPKHKIIMTGARTLTAVFEPKPVVYDSVILALDVNRFEWGTVQGAGKYAKGEEVTIKAVANPGYDFKQWKSGNVVLSSKAEYKFVLNSDSTVTGFFKQKIQYRGVINYAAKQVSSNSVRLTWEWPQEMVENYVRADGSGLYEIFRVEIYRRKTDDPNSLVKVGHLAPDADNPYAVPATQFIDQSSENPLMVDCSYTYFFEVSYVRPQPKFVTVSDENKLTVTIQSSPDPVQFVMLNLAVNNTAMGSTVGSGEYEQNDSVTIQAVPKAGYVFKEWQENGVAVSSSSNYRIKMDRSRSITAFFETAPVVVPDSVYLTLEADTEMGTVQGEGKYEKGESVTVTATAKKGYRFEAWEENGVPVSAKASYTIVSLTTDRTLVAVFVVNPDSVTLVLDADAEMGTVQGAGKFEKGKKITIKATPKEGYVFVAWKAGNGIFSKLAEYSFNINVDMSLMAEFAVRVDSVTLTLERNNANMGTVSGGGRYVKGVEVTITARPATGYRFDAWKAGEDVIATTPVHHVLLNNDSIIMAVFSKIPDSVYLTLRVNDTMMGTVYGEGKYQKYEYVTATAVAKDGYVFRRWKNNGTPVWTKAEYRFPMDGDMTLEAEFMVKEVASDSARLELSANDTAMGSVQGAGVFKKGTEVVITAVPKEGYVFQVWMDGGEVFAREAERKFILDADKNLVAVFASKPVGPDNPKDSATLSLRPNDEKMGTVQGAGKYPKGQNVTINAMPKDGYVFRAWMEGESIVSVNAEHSFALNADRSFVAVFVAKSGEAEDSVTLTLLPSDAKMGTVQGAGKYPKGQNVAIKAMAHAGYEFVAWMNGSEIVSKTAEHNLVLNGDLTLTALFVEETANEGLEQADWSVYVENQTMVLQSKAACQYEVYNMAGVLVKQAKVQGEYRIALNNSGLYIVRRLSSTGYSVKKVVVR